MDILRTYGPASDCHAVLCLRSAAAKKTDRDIMASCRMRRRVNLAENVAATAEAVGTLSLSLFAMMVVVVVVSVSAPVVVGEPQPLSTGSPSGGGRQISERYGSVPCVSVQSFCP